MSLAAFAERITARRKDLGLSREQLALQIGVHPNYVGYLERGLRRPGDGTLVALAEALQLDKAQLFALLNPLFDDVIRRPSRVAGPAPAPSPALQALLDDPVALADLGATRDDCARLAALHVFGPIRRTADYVRIYKLIREIVR